MNDKPIPAAQAIFAKHAALRQKLEAANAAVVEALKK